MKTFSERLRFYRIANGLSQSKLADRVGLTVQSYNNYEVRGYEPRYEILIKLAIALNVDVNTLVGYKSNKKETLLTKMLLAELTQIKVSVERIENILNEEFD